MFFRDYARGDMRHANFVAGGETSIELEDHFFVRRGDGTCAYFFDVDQVADLFAKHGFVPLSNELIEREIENRKTEQQMKRKFIQSRFQLQVAEDL